MLAQGVGLGIAQREHALAERSAVLGQGQDVQGGCGRGGELEDRHVVRRIVHHHPRRPHRLPVGVDRDLARILDHMAGGHQVALGHAPRGAGGDVAALALLARVGGSDGRGADLADRTGQEAARIDGLERDRLLGHAHRLGPDSLAHVGIDAQRGGHLVFAVEQIGRDQVFDREAVDRLIIDVVGPRDHHRAVIADLHDPIEQHREIVLLVGRDPDRHPFSVGDVLEPGLGGGRVGHAADHMVDALGDRLRNDLLPRRGDQARGDHAALLVAARDHAELEAMGGAILVALVELQHEALARSRILLGPKQGLADPGLGDGPRLGDRIQVDLVDIAGLGARGGDPFVRAGAGRQGEDATGQDGRHEQRSPDLTAHRRPQPRPPDRRPTQPASNRSPPLRRAA